MYIEMQDMMSATRLRTSQSIGSRTELSSGSACATWTKTAGGVALACMLAGTEPGLARLTCHNWPMWLTTGGRFPAFPYSRRDFYTNRVRAFRRRSYQRSQTANDGRAQFNNQWRAEATAERQLTDSPCRTKGRHFLCSTLQCIAQWRSCLGLSVGDMARRRQGRPRRPSTFQVSISHQPARNLAATVLSG